MSVEPKTKRVKLKNKKKNWNKEYEFIIQQ